RRAGVLQTGRWADLSRRGVSSAIRCKGPGHRQDMVRSVCVADGCLTCSKVIPRKPCSQPQTGVGFFLIPPRRTPQFFPEQIESEVHTMPVNKEFTIRLEDRPGTLGKVC